MPIPAAWSTVPVTWDLTSVVGTCRGKVRFSTTQSVTVDGDTFVPAPIFADVVDGVMTTFGLPVTDDPDVTPDGWLWKVQPLVNPQGPDAFYIDAPTAGGAIDLGAVVPLTGPASVDAASLADGALAQIVADDASLVRARLSARYRELGVLTSWPIYLYGNSYSILAAAFFTSGLHYSERAAEALGGGTVTSYGVGGKRIIDVLSTLIRGSAFPGCNGVLAAGLWTSTTARNGLVILETAINDFGHYPAMNVGTAIPAALPSANTKYRDTLKGMWRAALALMSSESRVEGASYSATSGTWTDTGSTYSSNGATSFTTAAGAYREYSLTPPQSGPLAGKVFLQGFTLEAAVGTMAQQQISVDGTLQTTRTPPAWEQYTGNTGAQVNVAVDCVAVTLPIDGAAHTVRVTHNGSAGHFLYVDCFTAPSTDPNPIAVMGAEHPLTGTPTWTAPQTAVYTQNEKTMTPDLKSVVAEFPNAFYVPSTMTSNGLYSGDGLHPNDRGQAQRAADLVGALQAIKPRLDNRALRLTADASFAIL